MCSACPEAIDIDTIPTWYCTTECQEKDLENHKPLCGFIQSHNGLFKAASVIHEVFCEVRDKLLAEITVELGDGAWVAFKNEDFAGVIDLVYMVKLPDGMTVAEVNLDQVKLYCAPSPPDCGPTVWSGMFSFVSIPFLLWFNDTSFSCSRTTTNIARSRHSFEGHSSPLSDQSIRLEFNCW